MIDKKQERTYLRFIDETLQGRELEKIVNERFGRKVFAYFENKPRFGQQEFILLLAELLHLAIDLDIAAKYMAERPEGFYPDPERQLDGTPSKHTLETRFKRLDMSKIHLEAFLPTVDPMSGFFKEKFEDCEEQPYLWDDNKKPVEFNLCFKFTIKTLTFEQKFDILHFLLCALNYLSKEKPKLQGAIEVLTYKRRELAIVATRKDERCSESVRAIEVGTRDIEIEKGWATDEFNSVASEKSANRGGRPKGAKKVPDMSGERLIDVYNELQETCDHIPTRRDLANRFQVEEPTIRNYLKDYGLNSMENLKIAAAEKKKG